MQVENIRYYLAFAYSDEKLAALLAHAEDGGLGYRSCCCLVGSSTAGHALTPATETGCRPPCPTGPRPMSEHLEDARRLPFGKDAEREFLLLGSDDAERRERLIPLIKLEMARREQAREKSVEEAGVTV